MKNHIQPKGQRAAAAGNTGTHHQKINVTRKQWADAYRAARQMNESDTFFQRAVARQLAAALSSFGGRVIAVEANTQANA